MTLEIREIPLNTVSMDKDMFLDNKTIAVEQEEKNIISTKMSSILVAAKAATPIAIRPGISVIAYKCKSVMIL